MATRYSGKVMVNVVYKGAGRARYSGASLGDAYECRVYRTGEGKPEWLVSTVVYAPACGFGAGVAFDSPEAYDQTARAALAFAADECPDVGGLASFDDSGFVVSRAAQ